jgi:hypothetical protein
MLATMRKTADGEEWSVTPTFEDATALDYRAELLPRVGNGRPELHRPRMSWPRRRQWHIVGRPAWGSGKNVL